MAKSFKQDMIESQSIKDFQNLFHKFNAPLPTAHVVLGSGFGEAMETIPGNIWLLKGEFGFSQISGLSASTVQDHPGKFRLMEHFPTKQTVLFQMGRIHGYEGHTPRKTVLPLMVSRLSGTKKFILTNAAGGLDQKMRAGDVMIIADHLNMTGTSPLVGENPKDLQGKEIGPRFPDLGNLYDSKWRNSLLLNIKAQKLNVFEGCYMGLLGPAYETHAEVRAFMGLGAKAVGMSTVWEAISLKHSGAKLAGVSLIANLAAGLTDEVIRHEDIMQACRSSASGILAGICASLDSEILNEV